jgi:Flp pilus assembly protein TadG
VNSDVGSQPPNAQPQGAAPPTTSHGFRLCGIPTKATAGKAHMTPRRGTPTSSRRAFAYGDDGAITVWVAIVAIGLLGLIGLVADGGNHLRAAQKADSIAAEAARTAGQAIDVGQVIANGEIVVDEQSAREAALDYLSAAGVSGSVSFTDDRRTIIVTVTVTYTPVMAELVGLDPSATGSARATLIRHA